MTHIGIRKYLLWKQQNNTNKESRVRVLETLRMWIIICTELSRP